MITVIIFTCGIVFSIWFIDQKIEPVLMDIAERKLDEFATRAINSAVRFAEDYDFSEVREVSYDDEGNPVVYNWNPAILSEINRVATDRVEEFFVNVNRGDPLVFDEALQEPVEYGDGAEDRAKQDPTLVEIPLGQITGNSVLANLGPRIPINIELVGNVRTNIVRKTEPFGITGSWVSLYLNVEADVQVIIPLTTEVQTVKTEIYLDGGAIIGDVPEFYGGEGGGPSISVPKEDFQNELQDEQ